MSRSFVGFIKEKGIITDHSSIIMEPQIFKQRIKEKEAKQKGRKGGVEEERKRGQRKKKKIIKERGRQKKA